MLPRAILTALAVTMAVPAMADGRKPSIAGPVAFDVGKVHDGDSFSGEALIWPGHRVTVNVRIRGIDAPELNSRCASERAMAKAAREVLLRRIEGAGHVRLTNIGGDKYNGRVIADVEVEGGGDLATLLLEAAAVRPYDGGKRQPWCG
jgi:micrococcal nuclease